MSLPRVAEWSIIIGAADLLFADTRRINVYSAQLGGSKGCRWGEDGETLRDGRGRALAAMPASTLGGAVRLTTKVFLARAHLVYDRSNNRHHSLKAFCQGYHVLRYRDEHRRRRSLTFRMRGALGDPFLGTYS